MRTQVVTRNWILALTVLLLSAQYATLQHEVKHPFHVADNACLAFIAADHQGQALPLGLPPAALPPLVVAPSDLNLCAIVALPIRRAFYARAPPA